MVPHQIRGFLSHFSQLMIVGHAYDKCTACSESVLTAFAEGRVEFVLKCIEDPGYLETIAGLDAMKQDEGLEDVGFEWDSDEDEGIE